MIKFSIIIPVYNVEKYIAKCLDSLLKQTYNNYEIIAVNDGSIDNSQNILDKYVNNNKEKIYSYVEEHVGLGNVRNVGVEKATGDYIIFVDTDDYIKNNLLEVLNNNILEENTLEVISYNLQTVDENYNKIETINKPSFNLLTGEDALVSFIESKKYFEPACIYAIKRDYFIANNFKFSKDKFHEDFGLIPKVILASKAVRSLDLVGYYYYQGSTSITRNCNEEKEYKKSLDALYHYDSYTEFMKSITIKEENRKILESYFANALILKYNNIPKKYKKEYAKELEKRKIYNYLRTDTWKRKLKKEVIKYKIKWVI